MYSKYTRNDSFLLLLCILTVKSSFVPTLTIHYTGNLRNEVTHVSSGSRLLTDAPPDNKGLGQSFSPSDLLCTALGTCMLTIIGISAREHQYSIEGARMEVTKTMASNPRRVSGILVSLFLPTDEYTEKEKMLIEKAARTCPVALSIHPDIEMKLLIHFGVH